LTNATVVPSKPAPLIAASVSATVSGDPMIGKTPLPPAKRPGTA